MSMTSGLYNEAYTAVHGCQPDFRTFCIYEDTDLIGYFPYIINYPLSTLYACMC